MGATRANPGQILGLALLVLLADCAGERPVAAPTEVAMEVALPERMVMPPALPRREAGLVLPDLSPTPRLAEPPIALVSPRVEAPAPPEPTPAIPPATPPAPRAAEPPAPVAAPAPSPPPPPLPEPAAVILAAAPVAPATAPPPDQPVAVRTPAPAREGARVQLVAAGSEAEAMRHWARFTQQAPDLAAGFAPIILAVERPDQSTIWRLRVGGFANAEAAQRWCAQLRERGLGCWVAG